MTSTLVPGRVLQYPNGTVRKSMEPWLKDEVEFYPHQIDGVRALANKNSFILADEMGLGKSAQALALFILEVIRNTASKLLIVCPVTLKVNWAEELEKFTRLPYTILEGTPAQRDDLLKFFAGETGPQVLIINYEQVAKHLLEINKIRFDIAVYDEAHFIKNHQSRRTKACLDIMTPRSFMLTGTPLLNHVNELWSLLHKIDPYRWSKYWSFVNRYCVFGGWKDKEIIGVKNEVELRAILDQYMLRRLAKDVLELKDPIAQRRLVTLGPEQRELYEDMKAGLFHNAVLNTDEEIENALVKFTRLKQCTGTTATFSGTDHSAKLDLAIPDLEEITQNGHKAVVFTQFLDMLDSTVRRLRDIDIPVWSISGAVKQANRIPTVNDWARDPRPGVIVCMLQVAGVGLNMTAASYGLFLDRLFVPGLNYQAICRLNRIGQSITRAVTIIDYIARDTMESRIDQILRTKTKVFNNVIEGQGDWKRALVKALKEAA